MPKVKFGEVARECREVYKDSQEGMPVVGLEHLEPETIQLTSWGTDADNTFTKAFHKGQMLFGRRRAYLKKAAQAPCDGICSGDITVIEAIADKLLPELLPFIVQNDCFFDFAVGHSAGSLSPRVKWEHLQNYEFELPDMDTQRRLAAYLWAMEETKTAYKNLISATDDLVKSQFVEMFGDPVNNPMGWPTMTMKEASLRLSDGPFGSNLKSEHYVPEGVRVIRLQNICAGYFLDDDKAYVSYEHYEKIKKYTCRAGDIVIGTLGEPNLRACLVPDHIDFAINKSDCVHYIPNPDILDKGFVCGFINSPLTLQMAIGDAHGNTRQRISSGQIAQFKIILPPIELQRRYSDFVVRADKSKFAAQQALADLIATQKALLRENLG